MSSPLLINEKPLQVLPTLACAVGLNEAMLLQQVQYWLNIKQESPARYGDSFRAGSDGIERWWVYNSISLWRKQFPFWSENTIRRALGTLIEQKVLFAEQLAEDTRDKTLWYSINYDRLNEVGAEYQAKNTNDSNKLPSTQNEQMACPKWGDPSTQNEQVDVPKVGTSRGRVNAGASFRDYSETTQRLSPLTPEAGVCVVPTISEQEESAASRKASARSPKPKGSAPAEGKPAPRCEAKWKPDDFNRLMVAYPKRGARADAAKVWDALRPNDEFAEMLFNAACRCSEHHRLKGDNGQYAKALGVWLRGECWNDPQCQPPAPAVSRPASRPTASGPTAPCSSAAPHSKNMNDDPLYRALQAQQARWGAARKERDAHLARILPPAALYAPESLFGDTP